MQFMIGEVSSAGTLASHPSRSWAQESATHLAYKAVGQC